MPKTIQQEITFSTSPEDLFNIYMDSGKHTKAIGAKAVISRKTGGKFSSHEGYIRGRNLFIIPGQMIVQTWRGSDWKKSDPDSILVLTFAKPRKGRSGQGQVIMAHAMVPDDQYSSLKQGWKDFYWKPWHKYISKKRK